MRAPQLQLAQARASLDQEVERGVELQAVVTGEIEELERLELADKRRDGAEAAVGEAEASQRLEIRELRREPRVL